MTRGRTGWWGVVLSVGMWGTSCAKQGKRRHTGAPARDSGARLPDSGPRDTAPVDTGDTGAPPDSGDTGHLDPLPRWEDAVPGAVWAAGDEPGAELGTRMAWTDAGLWVTAPGGAGEVGLLPEGPSFTGAHAAAHLGAALADHQDGVLAGAWSRAGDAEGAVYLLSAEHPGGVVEVDVAPVVVVPEGATGMVVGGFGAGEHPDGWLLGLPRASGDQGLVQLFGRDDHSEVARFTGAATGNLAGGAVAAADLDGDGLDDLVVGAWGRSGFSGAVQAVLAPFPAETSLLDADRMWTGDAWALAGFALATGDVDGDGHPDIVVGAFGDTRNGSGSGAFTVVPGGSPSGTLLELDAHRLGAGPDAHFGSSLAVADIDRDGRADITVGAPDASTGGTVQLHYGPVEGVSTDADAFLVDPELEAVSGLGTAVVLHPTLGWAAGAPDHASGTGRVLFAEATPRLLP